MDFWIYLLVLLVILMITLISAINRRRDFQAMNKQLLESNASLAKSQQETNQQKNLFKALFNSAVDGLTIVENGRLVDCNDSLLKMYKIKSKEDFRKGKPGTFVPQFQPDGQLSKEMYKKALARCLETGSVDYEMQVNDTQGELFWVHVILKKVDVNGSVLTYSVLRNITQQKKMEEELQLNTNNILTINKALEEQKNYFEALFDHTNDALTIIEDGKLIDCNRANLELYKFRDKEDFRSGTPGKYAPEFQPCGQRSSEMFKEKVLECNASGLSSFEIQVKDKEGRHFWVLVSLVKVAVNDKDIIYSVIRDIDEHKKMEAKIRGDAHQLAVANDKLQTMIENLNLTQSQLIDAEKMASLGGLVAGVAHEINTPIGISLTGITHFTELTNEVYENLNSNQLSKQALEKFFAKSQSLNTLIILNLTKAAELVSSFKQIAVDQTSEEKRQFNLREYSFEVLASLHTVIKKQDVEISIECSDSINLTSYPGAYSQVVTNLIMNSLIHGFKERGKGTIAIKLECFDNRIDMLYVDDGKGICAEVLAKIFDPFFTTNRDNGGSGLGLNIIYNIVTSTFNGTIKCLSEEGEGTRFIIVMYM